MKAWLTYSILTAAALYAIVLLLVYFFQRNLQYFPTHKDSKAEGTAVFKPWRDYFGNFVGYARGSSNPKRVVLFFHGNGGEALDRAWVTSLVPQQEIVVLLAEYPGYGGKPGSPTQRSILEAADVAVDSIGRQWKVPITVVGESLGTAVACYLASEPDAAQKGIDRLALISPFASLKEIAANHYPFLPVSWLLKDSYPSLDFIKTAKLPLYVVHGAQDTLVPLESGKKLFEAYPGTSKHWVEILGAGHNDLWQALVHSPATDPFKAFLWGE